MPLLPVSQPGTSNTQEVRAAAMYHYCCSGRGPIYVFAVAFSISLRMYFMVFHYVLITDQFLLPLTGPCMIKACPPLSTFLSELWKQGIPSGSQDLSSQPENLLKNPSLSLFIHLVNDFLHFSAQFKSPFLRKSYTRCHTRPSPPLHSL